MRRKRGGLTFYERKKILSGALVAEILSLLFYTAIAVVIAWLLVTAFGYRIHMTGSAMRPEIESNDTVFVNRIVYRLTSPKRGDIIVFYPSGNENAHAMIRRVVAIPGETVRIEDGVVYINDRPEPDPEHRYTLSADAGIAATGVTLGNKEYFVLGDMRNASEDSRSANIGAVSADSIIGKAWFWYSADDDS